MSDHPTGDGQAGAGGHLPLLIAWELTRNCPLACHHCRASAGAGCRDGELTTDECLRLVDDIASFCRPTLILTGGEPLLRGDVYDIARHATDRGLRAVLATCGTLLDAPTGRRLLASGVQRISLSLDGASAATHDAFRGTSGSYEAVLQAAAVARQIGLGFQINTTVTADNAGELGELLELALSLKAEVFNPFLLVPTGRGRALAGRELSPVQYEQTLEWLADRQDEGRIPVRVTCAPHYRRILRRRGAAPGGPHAGKGCMGGQSFAFISHTGKVQICGFLDVECGDVREDLSFQRVWQGSEVFQTLRDPGRYEGRCGRCEYLGVCGGCRARAYAVTGNWLAEEPFCTHQPLRP